MPPDCRPSKRGIPRDARMQRSERRPIAGGPLPTPLASFQDAMFQRFDPPVVFAVLDHRLMAMGLQGYKNKYASLLRLCRHLKNTE